MSGFIGIAVADDEKMPEVMRQMDSLLQDYTMLAARGECAWHCPDCCMTFPDGMPDECGWGHKTCTDLNARDKAQAITTKSAGGEEG